MIKKIKSSKESELEKVINRYEEFITSSNEAIWRIELEKPVSIQLSVTKQINHFYKYAYLAECNEAFARMYGVKSCDEINMSRLNELLPKNESTNKEYLRSFIKSGYHLQDAESKELDKKGRTVYFSNNLVGIVEKGYLIRAWGTQRDITKQRVLQEQLYHHAKLLENINDAVISVDLNGDIKSWNPGAVKLYGWTVDEVIGKKINEIVPVIEFINSSMNIYRRELEKKGIWCGEIRQLTKEGKEIYVFGNASLVYDDSNNQIGTVSVNRNITEQKKSENERNWLLSEVQYQRTRLNDIINDVPGIIWEAYGKPNEGSQRINFVSGYVKKMLGYSTQEWLETPNFWLKIVHPEDKEKAAKVANEMYEKKISGINQFRWITKKGKTLWVEAHSSVITDANGIALGMRGVTMDMTSSRIAEEALKVSEMKYRKLVQLAPDVIYSVDTNGIITSLSTSFELLTGFKVSDWVGKSFIGLIHPEDALFAEEQFVTGLQKPLRDPYEIRILTKKGKYIMGEIRSTPYYDNDNLAGIIGIGRDVTSRREMENALKENEERYRLVVENSMDLISVMTLDGKVIYASPSWERITGYSPELIINKYASDILHPDDLKLAEEGMEQILKGDQTLVSGYRIKHKSGKWITMEGSGAVIMDESNKPKFIVATSRDITERVEIEKRKDDFISMASHELRTPVTSLKLYTQLLDRQLSSTKEVGVPEALIKMNSQIDRLTNLIGDLLDLSRIQAGKLQIRKINFKLDELILDVVESMQATTTHKFSIKGLSSNEVHADKERITQVLINLLSNAIKYSPESEKIIVQAHKTDTEVIVGVQDFGRGISNEHIGKIFERFYQIQDRGISTGGLGIGLYISYEIVKRNGGNMWVKSKLGKGSTFYFSLPLKIKRIRRPAV